jgi:hypothetical protein
MSRKNQAKLTCLILFLAALFAALLTGNQTIRTTLAFAEGPNAGVTGAPGETTCAVSGCHGGDPNTGPGHFQISAPDTYEPGKSYLITVTHTTTDTTRRRWGFQLTALDGGNARAGDLQNTTSLTQVLTGGPGGNRQYVEHSFLGTFQGQASQASWTFNWVAPPSDVGTVTFYAAGNQANNSGTETGDQIYATTVNVLAANATTGPPTIFDATMRGKNLLVMGENFGTGAALLMDGAPLKKTDNDPDTPSTLIVTRKATKIIDPGQTVMLQVRNPDGTLSNTFSFTRPI